MAYAPTIIHNHGVHPWVDQALYGKSGVAYNVYT
jgi:hypothetical protein